MIETYRRDDVLEIVLNSPPVNELGNAERKGILDGIESAGNDAGIKAIVIRGDGKYFHWRRCDRVRQTAGSSAAADGRRRLRG